MMYSNDINFDLIEKNVRFDLSRKRINHESSPIYLRFSLRENVPYYMVKPFLGVSDSESYHSRATGNYNAMSNTLLALAFIHGARQVVSSLRSEPPGLLIFSSVQSQKFALPYNVNNLIKGLGNFNTKLGRAEVRYPVPTVKGFLQNASVAAKRVINSQDETCEENDFHARYYYQDKFSREEVKDTIARYFSESESFIIKENDSINKCFRLPEITSEGFTSTMIKESIPHSYPNKENIIVLCDIYFMSEEEYASFVENPDHNSHEVLKNVLDLTRSTLSLRELCLTASEIHIIYINKFIFKFRQTFNMVESSVTGFGSPGQVFVLESGNRNNYSKKVRISIPVADVQRVHGLEFTPCQSYEVQKDYEFTGYF